MTENDLLFQLHLNVCIKYYSADNAKFIWKYRAFDRFPRNTCYLHVYIHESDFDFRHGFTGVSYFGLGVE